MGKTVILIVVLVVIIFGVLPLVGLPLILYSVLLVRTSKKKWARECSILEDEEYKRMFDIGMAWGEENASKKTEVEIVSEGYKLVGEYFDFGFERAVVIVPGRMESLLYSYYFSNPYKEAGYNVLEIDNRSHGLSEGHVNSLGYKEYKDLLNWARFLHDEKGVKSVVFHGICIGSSASLFALTDNNCPDYVSAMVAEGMYVNFSESFKNHFILDGRKLFPIYYICLFYMKIFSGADVVHDGPIARIDKLNKPILFMHSRQDKFSLPEKAQEIYDKCVAPKRIIWYDIGDHSRIRINNTEKYDSEIVSFLETLE